MRFLEKFYRQFGRPEGALGEIAGWIMASRPSNRQRNHWTVDLLHVWPSDRVLELGCGPGIGLRACAEKVTQGVVVGLDHSSVMLEQAARRNRQAIARGSMKLELGDVNSLPMLRSSFDKIFSVNVVQFLPRNVETFQALYEVLVRGGIVASTYQPRHRNATREDTLRVAQEIATCMTASGFEGLRVEELPLMPVPAICVLGRKL